MSIHLEQINLENWFKDKGNRRLIRKKLPTHFAKTIAEKHKCSHNTVYQIMAGNYFSLKLFLALLELAAQNETVEKDLQNKAIDILENNFNQTIKIQEAMQEATQEATQKATPNLEVSIEDLTKKAKHEQSIEHSKRICTGNLFEP